MQRRDFIRNSALLAGSLPLLSKVGFGKSAPVMHITKNGKASVVIVIPNNPNESENTAAKELQEYVEQISGAKLEITHADAHDIASLQSKLQSQKLTPVFLGSIVFPQLQSALGTQHNTEGAFVLRIANDGAMIAGVGEGTYFGAMEFLEQLGVRWFMPGKIGTVIPSRRSLQLPVQETVQVPSFKGRWMNAGRNYAAWGKHLRMGGSYFPGSHGIPGIKKADFAKHPEYFALVNGERSTRQLDISNPDVVTIAIEATKKYFSANPESEWIGMGPNDGSGFCECDRCKALDGGDWDPFSNELSMTDRYIWFFNQVLDGIKEEFPDKKVCFYSYHAYMRIPVKHKPNHKIVPAFAPIGLCRIHGMNNPVCPEKSYIKTVIKQWGEILPETYDRGYWFNLADPSFPFSMVNRMREQIPTEYEMGIKGWRVETVDAWGSESPSLYIAGKLMWNHEADVDVLLHDFYQKYFGPAQKPMAGYFTAMDAAIRDGDYHTGCSFDLPHLYSAELRQKADRSLREAERAAGKSTFGERVKIFRTTFDYLQAFISMLENQAKVNFVAANNDLMRLDEFQKVLLAYDPPMIRPREKTHSYLKRFFREPVEQGFERVQAANGLVVPLADEWQFHLDPQKIGEDIGLWKANLQGGNWQPLKTSSLSWSDQGLRYYKGEAWYRQEVEIPSSFKGKHAFLWFGGVDEKAKVWVNGKEVGISHGASFLPFEFDATDAVTPGQTNVIAVRLLNEVVNELGTGGITAPVMFYVPADGAQPDNIRALSPTFP